VFHTKLTGTRDTYLVNDIEEQLKNTIVSHMTDTFAGSSVPFLDMAANQAALAQRIGEGLKPVFADLGLMLDAFVVENLSLPDELQKTLDARIGMNMVGDINRYAQFQAGTSLPIAAANEGGGGGTSAGLGLGAGIAMGQQLMNAMRPDAGSTTATAVAPPPDGTAPATKFCISCGKSITRTAKFCPECGSSQQ
jgi:membrane protease subunit (stomatin/prohibitin family)